MTQLKGGGCQPRDREEHSSSASTVIARWQEMAGTSRVNREVYARFCGRLEVKSLRPTRHLAYGALGLAVSGGAALSNIMAGAVATTLGMGPAYLSLAGSGILAMIAVVFVMPHTGCLTASGSSIGNAPEPVSGHRQSTPPVGENRSS
jgi:hypothetical protein